MVKNTLYFSEKQKTLVYLVRRQMKNNAEVRLCTSVKEITPEKHGIGWFTL